MNKNIENIIKRSVGLDVGVAVSGLSDGVSGKLLSADGNMISIKTSRGIIWIEIINVRAFGLLKKKKNKRGGRRK